MSFTANAPKYDPYRRFKFLVKWDGAYVAGVSRVTGLSRGVEAVDWRSGGDAGAPTKVPGLATYPPLVLERAASADRAFSDWMDKVSSYQGASGTDGEAMHDFRKDLLIELYNQANEMVLTFAVYKAWPVDLSFGELDAQRSAMALEQLTLVHEGWKIIERPGHPDDR